MSDIRPGQITSQRMGLYSVWAAGALVPGGSADPDLCRQDYIMWCSDHMLKPEPRSKQRATVIAAGGKVVGFATGPKSVSNPLNYLGVTLAPPPGTAIGPEGVGRALGALRDAGIISPADMMKAVVELLPPLPEGAKA